MDSDEINNMAQQVYELCGRRLSDIRVDLIKTKSAEATINRVFDGTFLEGTDRDPSLKPLVILDSDEEEVGADDQLDLTSATMAERPASHRQGLTHATPNRNLSALTLGDAAPLSPPSEAEYTRRQKPLASPSSLHDGDSAIPLLLTGPHSSFPTRMHCRREQLPVLSSSISSSSAPLASTSPPSRADITSNPAFKDVSPPRGQCSRRSSLSFSPPESTNTPNSDALHPQDSPRQVPPNAAAPQGTSIFDPIDIDDEDSVNMGEYFTAPNTVTKHLRSPPPKVTTARHGQAQRKLVDDVMTRPATSSMALDFLKEWEYSSSDDDGKGGRSTIKPQQPSKLEQRKVEREAKKREMEERKQQEKEAKQRRKEEHKAEKEKKRLLEQANRVRSNRQELYSEMILDVDREFYASPRGELLRQVVIPKEAELRQVDTMYYTVAWHRKTRAAWDEKQGTFIPHPNNQVQIVQEPKILVFMDAAELCEIVQSSNRDDRIDRIKRACGGRQVLLMIEGLDSYYKRKNLLQQRSFEQSVIQNLSGEASSSTHSSRVAKRKRDALMIMAEEGPTRNQMEDALTYFQLVKDIMLVPTTDEADSIDWIMALTADIASAIYKDRSRHLKQGSSRCGKDATETWNKVLQEIQLCTPPVANAVAAAYPNAQALHQAYGRATDRRYRAELLADIEVDRGVLASRGRTINNHMSKKICTIFTSDDPSLYIA